MLWIPRPLENGERFKKLLAQHGIDSVCLPLIDITFLKPDKLETVALCDQLFFFSRYAVKGLINSGFFPSRDQRIYAIGPGTVETLEQRGISVNQCVSPPHNSESFIENSNEFNLLGTTGLVTGENGRKMISEYLTKKGFSFIDIPVYRRTMPPLDEKTVLEFLHQQQVSAVLLTSLSMLSNLCSLGTQLHSALRQKTFFVNSERLAHACRKIGFFHVIISKQANNSAMLDSILLYFKELR